MGTFYCQKQDESKQKRPPWQEAVFIVVDKLGRLSPTGRRFGSKNYDWKLLKTLLKENTFTELANLCLPNNKEVNGDEIKATLTQTYKTMYISENQTENAVDHFLLFCAERTELFVPASGENCFKFFHRSFFEYFYSQYIFTRMTSAEEVFNAWRAFDIDSEVFELTIALYKQKNQRKFSSDLIY